MEKTNNLWMKKPKKNVIYNKIHLLLGELEEDDSKKIREYLNPPESDDDVN